MLNVLKLLSPLIQALPASRAVAPSCILNTCRSLTSLTTNTRSSLLYGGNTNSVLSENNHQRNSVNITQPSRSYKVRTVLKRRCAGCYFERRKGRLYVECTLKPRHKQMQQQKGHAVYKDDYSKGPWKLALNWGWEKREQYYKLGDNQFSRYKWLDGRIGKDL